MNTLSLNQILYGTDEAPAPARPLRAGPLAIDFNDGNLRAIHWRGHEVLRAISYLVRDENWGTHAPLLTGLDIREEKDRFTVSYKLLCEAGTSRLACDARIEADADGRLVFDVTATPQGDFPTNRAGFCILHPIVGVAGSPAEVEHVDGSVEKSRFPELIDPAQPFFSMRRITHEVAPGLIASCLMEGDAFEMEDQRNWTDASYKTYVRPLALPWPYTLPSGKPVRQTVTLTLAGTAADKAGGTGDVVDITLGDGIADAPAIGLVITPEEASASLAAAARLEELGAQHLILHFDPSRGHGPEALGAFAKLLARCPLPATLELVVPCRADPEAEIAETARQIAGAHLELAAVAVSPAPDLKSTPPGSVWPACPPLDEIYRAARKAFPDLPLGGGMFSYFTELNRKRVPAERLDFITHTTSPLVHAADDRSVMETLETMPFVTRSVRAIFGDKPYRLGPSTIGMRHNPYGARLADNPGAARRMTMTADDPRQKGLFSAAWMVGYAASVASAKLTHLTVGALTGAFGVLGEGGYRPAFHAARILAAMAGKPLRTARSADPARVLAHAAGDTLVAANLTPEPVDIAAPQGMRLRAILDETTFSHAHAHAALPETMTAGHDGVVRLGGYAVALFSDKHP